MKKIYFIAICLLITLLSFSQTYSSGTQTGSILTPPDPGASKFIRLKIQNLHSTGYAGIVMIVGSDTTFIQSDQTGKLVISSFTTGTITSATSINTGTSTRQGISYYVKDGDSLIINMSTALYPFDLRINAVRMFAIDSTGKVITTGTINSQTISSAANLTGTLSVAGITTHNNQFYVVKDGDSLQIDMGTKLYSFDLRHNSAWKFRIDTVGNVVNAGTINGLTIANGISGLVTVATAAVRTDSVVCASCKMTLAANKFVTITSANVAYIVQLPIASANFVGGEVRGFVGSNGCKLRLASTDETSGTVYLNNQTGNKHIALAANSFFIARQISATQWIVTGTDVAGTALTVTPAAF